MTKAETKTFQELLLAAGYELPLYGADGGWGAETRTAMQAFQRDIGLSRSQTPDKATIAALKAVVASQEPQQRQSTSPIGQAVLISREALRTKAYQDSVGIWTIGVGHTAAAGFPFPEKGMVISEQEARELFAHDLKPYEQAVRDAITVPLADHQFDALLSICFNIGPGGFKGSSFVRRINAGESPARIRDGILMWKKPPEILTRRTAEADQYQTPYAKALPKARSNDKRPIRMAA